MMTMSLEAIPVEIAKDFLAAKKLFEKIGFELIGTKDGAPDVLYVAKKRGSKHTQ